MIGWRAAPGQEAFRGPAGEFVIHTAPHTEADAMALLIQFLVAFGVAAGRHAEASRHYPNEFAVLVGPSSKDAKAQPGTTSRPSSAPPNPPSPTMGSCPDSARARD